MDIPTVLGEALLLTLAQRDATQEGLGEAAGMNQRTVSKLVRGSQDVTVVQMVAVDLALGDPPGAWAIRARIIRLPAVLRELALADPTLDEKAREDFIAMYALLAEETAARRVALTRDATE